MKYIFFIILIAQIPHMLCSMPMYICTAADARFYEPLLTMIASVHNVNFSVLQEIAVFDLGFKPEQRKELNRIAKVHVYDIEMTHPDLLTHFRVDNHGKIARGWYAWKPVVIKQALDMFPYVLYIDAGITVLRPLDVVFATIKEHGYFLIDCGHSIRCMLTKPVIDHFALQKPNHNFILDQTTYGLTAGFQGLSRSVYNTYVLPTYLLSKDHFDLFRDDGSAPGGFGSSRHDQALFSVQARLAELDVFDGMMAGALRYFKIGKDSYPFHVYSWLRFSRLEHNLSQMREHLRYK